MNGPVVIVDPVSSGAELAPGFAQRQIPSIAVKSMGGALWDAIYGGGGFGCQIQTSQFLQVYEDGPELLDLLRQHRPSAVLAGAESGVELADRLAAQLTPRYANEPALAAARRHKGRMQEALRQAGLPVIPTLTTACPEQVRDWLQAQDLVGRALVVKPAASAGSDNVHHIPAGGDWRGPFERILASRNTLRGEANETVIVQERVVGTEFAVDTVSAAGDHVLAHLIRYGKRASEGLMLFDHTEFLAYDDKLHGEMLAYVCQVLDAVGIRWGAAHCEVMLTEQGPRLIEVGARTCGGPVLGFSRAATGSSQLERVVEAYADGHIQSRNYRLQRTVVPVFLSVPASGSLHNLEVLEPLRQLSTHLVSHLWRREGDRVSKTIDLDTVIGIIALAGEREAVWADYQRVREAESRLRIEPNPSTG